MQQSSPPARLPRNHYIRLDGRLRDALYFHIIDKECPEVKRDLEEKPAG